MPEAADGPERRPFRFACAVPALVLAVVCGVSIGMFAALSPERRVGSGGVAAAYLLFALPGFWLGGMLFSLTLDG